MWKASCLTFQKSWENEGSRLYTKTDFFDFFSPSPMKWVYYLELITGEYLELILTLAQHWQKTLVEGSPYTENNN